MDQRIVNRRYRIDRLLGEGGMAEVFLGQDLLLNRPVAVKKLRPQFARDPNFRTRFEREAQAAASFTHPNIIDIYDVGEEDGTPYIVMEYVPGDNLAEIIEAEGPFDPDDVAALIEQVGAALDYAHERGFVHRDIKPHNILVDNAGLARVVDFGIAKGLADSDLTETGAGLGTVHYTSPEQASGLMATPSSDTYSLGVVAYEMLTGRLPFEADTTVGIAMKHITDLPTHPSDINREVPRSAGDIVMRALGKNPTARFSTAGAFAGALTEWRSFAETGVIARIPAGATTVLPAASPRPQPVGAETAIPARASAPKMTAPPVHPAPTGMADGGLAAPARAEKTGCVGWMVAIAVLAGLGALIWFGFQLAPRVGDPGDDADPTRTPESPTESVATQPAAQPTSPAIIPRPTESADLAVVPLLTGMTLEEAEVAADEAGLVVEESGREPSDDVEEGVILSQDPEQGEELEPDSSVSVVVSSGPAMVDIADLGLPGLPADDAESALTDQGLVVARQEQASTEVAEGLVIDAEPSGAAAPGETVTILVSVGDKIQVPREIQANPLEDALSALEDAGFEVTETIPVGAQTIEDAGIDLEASGIENQDVVGIQDNDASFGAWLPPGTAVTLVVYDSSLDED